MCDALAFPDKAKPEFSHGVTFFNAFRDLTATGFFTSQMGIADLEYMGNTFVATWTGAPKEALDHLGVSYVAAREVVPGVRVAAEPVDSCSSPDFVRQS